MSSIYKHLKFLLLGVLISLATLYCSLDLLPKVFTVLPSYPALLAILVSVVLGFGSAGCIMYFKCGAQ